MAQSPVLYALHNKYRYIKGELASLDNQCEKLLADMMHLEQTIMLFANDWSGDALTGKKPYRPSRWASRGQGIRTALVILKEATAPMSARDIVIAVTRRLDMSLPVPKILYQQSASMNTQLSTRIGKGVVRHEGKPIRWSIAQ
ncbi:hypothetical protein [Sphingorhabdus sp.]|jgi:hypothetical protein|uniref:hypothetical protein n=1 Tax=Sphingorhabdus sp. TaxID=1902408 RepID=UPI0037C97DD4